MPAFKYQNDINTHSSGQCPPVDGVEMKIEAFRYVNNPMTLNDFTTYIGLGKLPRQTDSSHIKCKHCGLSMFASIDSILKNYKNYPQKENLKYTHIASGIIEKKFGICTIPSNKGHFTLFEYEGIDLNTAFTITSELE
jgi:hypothetical protein